jgi:hypothetical protein
VVENNLVVSGQSAVPGVFVSTDAVKRNTNYVDVNMYHNLGSSTTGIALLWDYVPHYSAATIDEATGQSRRSGRSLVETPDFTAAATPGTDGLALSRKPSLDGAIVTPAARDIRGVLPEAGDARFGAYYKTP